MSVQVTARAEAFLYVYVKLEINHIYGNQWKPWLPLTSALNPEYVLP
jgi:hypothetical protein